VSRFLPKRHNFLLHFIQHLFRVDLSYDFNRKYHFDFIIQERLPRMEFKQCIVVREDLKLSAGKLAVQVAHAAVMAVERAEKMDKSIVSDWKKEGQKKVILKVAGVPDLFRVREDADRAGIPSAIVADAGLTEIPAGTITALGLGPAPNKMMDKVTGKLRLV
jgi:PTH2 family peptidyl-tRNA hydrolase